MRSADETGPFSTSRTILIDQWPGDRVEISNDKNQGGIMLQVINDNRRCDAADAESATVLLDDLDNAREIYAALGEAIAAAEKTVARMDDHLNAVSHMRLTGSVGATYNDETVHRTPIPTSDLEPSSRCLMCSQEGHQVGPSTTIPKES